MSPDAEIDLHGCLPGNVRWKLLPFLDQGLTEEWTKVYVIHGEGEGVLRGKVREILDELDYVVDYRPARYTEGGEGITVVFYE